MIDLKIHTDGSCLGNPGPGGWCFIIEVNDKKYEESGSEKYTTNNRMELLSVIKGLERLGTIDGNKFKIIVYSDSQYVTKGISEWLPNWIKKNFKNIKNDDLWKRYTELSKNLTVETVWVKGHNGDIMNERCNKLAQEQAKTI